MVQSKSIGKVTELTLINPIKPGKGPTLRAVLTGIKPELVRQMETIHFARWVLIDNDTRLLFTSNFDRSLNDYLKDFVRVMPEGLDSIWGNCEGYPAGGCKDFDAFSAFVSNFQVETTLWYAAYPAATVKDVLKALDVKAKADNFVRDINLPVAPTVGQP
jgi:hypothetical protein